MMKAQLSKEIIIRIPNRVGLLSEVCGWIAEQGAIIWAATCLVEGNDAIFHLATDHHDEIVQMLKQHSLKIQERTVVNVELSHRCGMLALLTGILKEAGIDIHHFNTTALTTVPNRLVALCCSNNELAVQVINKKSAQTPTDKKYVYHSS